MAKKINKPVIKTEEVLISLEDVKKLAKELNCPNESIYDIQAWIRKKFNLHAEIFYSMFHKKFSINNYFIDLSNGKKIEWNYKSTMYDSYDEALIVALYNLLILVK